MDYQSIGTGPPPDPGDRGDHARGFTAMELLVGIGILGLVLAIGLPGIRQAMESMRHDSSVSQVTSRLFLTRQMAVREKRPYVVTLNAGNMSFSVFEDTDGDGVRDAGEPTLGPYVLGDGVTLQNVSWAGNRVTFLPNGSASQTGDVNVVSARGRTSTVRVHSITGNPEVLP